MLPVEDFAWRHTCINTGNLGLIAIHIYVFYVEICLVCTTHVDFMFTNEKEKEEEEEKLKYARYACDIGFFDDLRQWRFKTFLCIRPLYSVGFK